METLLDLLEESAGRYGDRNALGLRRDDGTTFHWSYREVRRRARLAAWRLRALGLQLSTTVQVSTNIEDHTRTTMADVVAAVREHAPVTGAELVAPAPRAAHADFPQDVPLRGPKPLEDHLTS